jgi:hypothetical protein
LLPMGRRRSGRPARGGPRVLLLRAKGSSARLALCTWSKAERPESPDLQ